MITTLQFYKIIATEDLTSLSDEMLEAERNRIVAHRNTARSANNSNWLSACDERLAEIYNEMTNRICSDSEYIEWLTSR